MILEKQVLSPTAKQKIDLNLDRNKIGKEGMKYFSLLNFPELENLYLRMNKIEDKG